jgi:hypothetical protein
MNKTIVLIVFGITALLVLMSILGKSRDEDSKQILGNQLQESSTQMPQTVSTPADRIEVVHFHATQQCWSCITVGEYAKKTIEEKFPQEFAEGKIVFLDVNGELVQNREIVNKYKAGGSSLFVNAIRGDLDNIAEDTTVWRLIGNEKQFIDYFEKKLKNLLGG